MRRGTASLIIMHEICCNLTDQLKFLIAILLSPGAGKRPPRWVYKARDSAMASLKVFHPEKFSSM